MPKSNNRTLSFQRVIFYHYIPLEKKTIVLDIDETLVYASHNFSEIPSGSLDTTIRIKINKYGGAQKAYLSFRPYLFEMLGELV